MSVQLHLNEPELPAAFVARWRELEREHGLRAAHLDPEAVVCERRRWWIGLRIDGRREAVFFAASPAAAAERIFKRIHPTTTATTTR